MNEMIATSSSPRRIRHSNTIVALQTLFDYGSLSRAELARHLGLNRSSSGHIVAELVASALVREVPDEGRRRESQARAGRPGILLELAPDAALFVGAEIGVEHITTLQIDLAAEIVECRVEPFDGRAVGPEQAVAQAVTQAFEGMPADRLDRLEGFGLSAPAQMDREGLVRIAPLLGWKDVELAALARSALQRDVPIMVENEANSFAFGESYRDRETRQGVTLFMVIETGVGGGIVIDGRLFRGGHGLAGEIGHLRLPTGEDLEQVLGLEHLMRRYSSVSDDAPVSLAGFLQDVRDREPRTVEIAEEWARNLAQAVAEACRLIDPNRIVLGGSVAALYPLVEARVAHHLGAAQAATFPVPEIILHRAAETGAAYGAACMLHRRFMSLENRHITEQAMDDASAG
ncbi:MAG: ROK family transcriptional regulator [Paracoccus sp.]|nr:ROK family transcriptional regulator [Paracoccus sp. (in: a-proteobacteria)]